MGLRRDTDRGVGGGRAGRRWRPVSAALLCALAAAVWLTPAAAAEPTDVLVRVVGSTETLFEGPVLTEGHDVEASSDTEERSCDGVNPLDPENVTPGPTPTAAAVDAMAILGETFNGAWYAGYQDYLITRWGPESSASWGVFVNDTLLEVGGCQYELGEGAEVLWSAGSMSRPPLGLFAEGTGVCSVPLIAKAKLGVPWAAEVVSYQPKSGKPTPAPERAGSSPSAGATVVPVQTAANGVEEPVEEAPEAATTNAEGKASLTFTTSGWHRIMAIARGTVRSNRIDVCVPAPGAEGCGAPPPEDDVRLPPEHGPTPEGFQPSPPELERKCEQPATRHQSEPTASESGSTNPPTAQTGGPPSNGPGTPVSSPVPAKPATRGVRIDGLTLRPVAATSRTLHYGGHWRRRTERGALAGAVMLGAAGATATATLAPGRPVFILRDMPRPARVEVRAGGHHRTFALRGSPSRAPRLLLAARRARAGAVTLRVIAGTVGIDGVAVTP